VTRRRIGAKPRSASQQREIGGNANGVLHDRAKPGAEFHLAAVGIAAGRRCKSHAVGSTASVASPSRHTVSPSETAFRRAAQVDPPVS